MKKYQKAKINIINLLSFAPIASVMEDWLVANDRDLSQVTDAQSYSINS